VQVIPFFDGERVPAIPSAYGVFKNLSSLNCKQENIVRATTEAVTFTLRWGFDRIISSFPAPTRLVITGGGANSVPWRQILADVFNQKVNALKSDEGGALGAALQAMYLHQSLAGKTRSLSDICEQYVQFDPSKETGPIQKNVLIYRDIFESYKAEVQREWNIS
ncbi:MAG: xylulokinase, partial [Treponema sp.]|nr:xylulokinase [Treponema sp.]